ncbi:hypothetical protein DVA67_032435 [Solirubrobacter sp. CPCC 204708]|uniref:Uncharacterized protein n=1 Tax=Solirubrobacter deserti TaxID=2282478 RepID=A0ABT4RQT1_9ACTN|nr:hypothetical protein [Solirubrobacter deserti]MBE2320712.1 hypothetical protein [Solirubrobacter deserti]MDA0140937.1 hypothetical protein [Solirubrobacter deserti]
MDAMVEVERCWPLERPASGKLRLVVGPEVTAVASAERVAERYREFLEAAVPVAAAWRLEPLLPLDPRV